jgi:TonB family protein
MESIISVRSFFLVLTLTSLVCTAFATKKDAEAAELIEHAKQLSDIRAEGAPAFRLKMSFKILKEDGSVLEGSHTEDWVSKTQWRRQTVLGDFREIQTVAGRKRWVLTSSSAVPEHLGDFLSLTDIFRFQPEAWKPQKIEDQELNGNSVRCVETNPNAWGGRSALCFDKISSTITANLIPSQRGTSIVETTCFYSDYQKFGDRVLARSYQCGEDKHVRLEAKVVELTVEPATDPAFFTPPDGAKESVNCLTPIKHPTAVYQPDPKTTELAPSDGTLVVIRVVVGTDGKPHDLTVTSAPNRDSDLAALEAVRQWTFKPATCDGEPIGVAVEVDIDLRHP